MFTKKEYSNKQLHFKQKQFSLIIMGFLETPNNPRIYEKEFSSHIFAQVLLQLEHTTTRRGHSFAQFENAGAEIIIFVLQI